MNKGLDKGNGGENIKPSARKSIHSHCRSCQNCGTMGKYGLPSKRQEHNLKTMIHEQGTDEVDNVMSKMARPASPVAARCINKRRNSDVINNEYSEDDESENENVLSKSSPATFWYSSDEMYASAIQNVLERSRGRSTTSFDEVPERSRMSDNSFHNHTLPSNTILKQSREKNSNNSGSNILPLLGIIVCILSAIICYVYYNETTEIGSVYDKFRFYNDVKDLGKKYKITDSSVLQVKTGIATIVEKQDTGSFIFAYNSKKSNFDPVQFNDFVENIAMAASKYLRNNSKEVHHVVIDTIDLKIETEKEFMNQYEKDVDKTGVMLVKDIDKIPSKLAMAFHYYCDEYNPLVKKSAIFFTLNVARCSNDSDRKSTHEYVEKCLAKKWSTVDQDKIGPLLTRVVNVVVDVTNMF